MWSPWKALESLLPTPYASLIVMFGIGLFAFLVNKLGERFKGW